jgi:hypothetical protein
MSDMLYRSYVAMSERIAFGLASEAVRLDTNGVVIFPGGMMHPKSYRDICGEAAYQALLKLPRVQSEYTDEELSE